MTKKDNKIKGNYGEDAAVEYLIRKGLSILCRNFLCRHGEIDIIAKDGETIVFAEVKYRHSTAYGLPGQAVDRKKQHHIIKSALYYLQQHRLFDQNVRFDVIEVLKIDGRIRIRQIEGAFDMGGYC